VHIFFDLAVQRRKSSGCSDNQNNVVQLILRLLANHFFLIIKIGIEKDIIIIIIRYVLGLDTPASASSSSLFQVFPSGSLEFGLKFGTTLASCCSTQTLS
jgi:hypothetical protein